MINGMPKHAQTAIQGYLDTGKFKNHTNESTYSDAAENKEAVDGFRANIDEFTGADNVPDLDLDPRDGHIRMESPYFNVTGRFQTAEDGTKEAFQILSSEGDEAVIYMRDSGDSLDMIAVSEQGSADEGVQHYDVSNHEKSFMSIEPQG